MPTILKPDGVFEDVIEEACQRYNITWEELRSRRKPRRLARAREDIAVALRARGWSFPLIGKLLRKDHSTIVLMVQRAAKRGAIQPPPEW